MKDMLVIARQFEIRENKFKKLEENLKNVLTNVEGTSILSTYKRNSHRFKI